MQVKVECQEKRLSGERCSDSRESCKSGQILFLYRHSSQTLTISKPALTMVELSPDKEESLPCYDPGPDHGPDPGFNTGP